MRGSAVGVAWTAALLLASPASAQWATTSNDLSEGRYQVALEQLPSGQVLAAGGIHDGSVRHLFSTEIYDPDTDLWTSGQALPAAHRGDWGVVALVGGQLLFAGNDEHSGGHLHPTTSLRFVEGFGWTTTTGLPSDFPRDRAADAAG